MIRCLHILLILLSLSSQAQEEDQIFRNRSSVTIPFELHNHFIVLKVNIYGLPLKFILDTGAEHTILFQREISDLLGIQYERRVRLMGADLSEELYGLTANQVPLIIEEQVRIQSNLVILEEDFINLDPIIGQKINGIIGGNILRQFVVHINYHRGLLTLHKPDAFKGPPRNFQEIPILVQRSKPYLPVALKLFDKEPFHSNLLIDSGASLSLLLYASQLNKVSIPSDFLVGTLGIGLGGELQGYIGRIERLEFGEFSFEQIVSNFQSLELMDSSLLLSNRDGILGNVILSQFHIIIDYSNATIYLKPNRYFKKRIRYDRSGLSLLYGGTELDEMVVLDVIPKSPAAKAGLQTGDRITHFQGIPARFFTMEGISRRLSGREGKKIRLRLEREGENLPKRFRLQKLL